MTSERYHHALKASQVWGEQLGCLRVRQAIKGQEWSWFLPGASQSGSGNTGDQLVFLDSK